MQAGMGGSAIPLSEFLNPTPPGQFRVGALGTQLGQLGPRALQILLPLAMQRFQQRQEDAAFQRSLAELPEDQREAAWKAHYHPKAFAADVQAESQKRAEQAALDKERRAALLEAAKNERELGEKIDAERRAQAHSIERMGISDALIRGRSADELRVSEAKRNRDIENLRSSLGEVGPQYAQMASEIGMALPEGKLRYMATPEQKKKWSEMTGDPGQDIVTDEDLKPIQQRYLQYKALMSSIPKQEIPEADPNAPWHERIVAGERRVRAGQERYGPAVLLDDEEKMKDFQERTKIHGGDAAKAWSELRTDAVHTETTRREAHREVRADAKEERMGSNSLLKEILQAKAEIAAADAEAAGVMDADEAGKTKALKKKGAAEGKFEAYKDLYKHVYGDLPDFVNQGSQPAKAGGVAPSAPDAGTDKMAEELDSLITQIEEYQNMGEAPPQEMIDRARALQSEVRKGAR